MASAIVLSAGFGTRLRPLTDELPKALVPVGDRPLLAHIADVLHQAGIAHLVVNTHHKSELFSRYLDSLSAKVDVVHEPEIRGTAGGVAGAQALFEGSEVLVWNGDILTRPPVTDLLARAAAGGLVLAVAPRPNGSGSVGLDDRGRVVRLRGERFGEEVNGGDYIGIAGLGARARAALPDRGCLIGDVALPLLRAGGTIETVPHSGTWSDIGSLEGYWRANLEWLEQRAAESWFGEQATVDGARVTGSVIGAGARIEGSGALARCVVWPHATAVAPLSDAIVTPRAVVHLT